MPPRNSEVGFLQPAITLPRRSITYRIPTVRILHPDYGPAENTLLVLHALDDGGVDYDIAIAAAGIVAGNKWTGFFATRDPGGVLVPVVRSPDGILRTGDYFFQLPDADVSGRPYPVVVRFSDWYFPHDDIPSPWAQLGVGSTGNESAPMAAVTASCRLTDSGWGVETAHIVPRSEQTWWNHEEMDRYTITDRSRQATIDTNANTLNLRSDMHKLFGDKVFSIVPKREAQDAANRLSLAIHVFNPISDDYFNATYHNRKLLPFTHSVEYLFARFAWTVFSPGILGRFLNKCVTERRVLVADLITCQYVVERRNPEQTNRIFQAARSESASPRKRSAAEMANERDATEADSDSGFRDTDDESPVRGRTMKRRRWNATAECAL